MSTKTDSYFKNPVLNSLVSDFEKYYDEQLKCFDTDEFLFQPALEEANFGQFFVIINGLENVAVHHLNEVVTWLVDWHHNKVDSCTPKVNDLFISASRELLSWTCTGLCDACLLLCLRGCLTNSEQPLEKTQTRAVLTLTYKILKDHFAHATSDTKRENFNYVSNLAATLLDSISSKNLLELEKTFLTELETAQSPAMVCVVIQSLVCLRVRVFSVDHVEGVFKILAVLAENLAKVKDKDLRLAYITILSHVLTTFSDVAKTELNIPIVKSVVSSLTGKAADFLKKVRFQQAALPLATALLCCSTKSAFFNNYFNMAVTLVQFTKSKDLSICKAALECLERVVWVYANRFECESREKTLKFFNFLNANLFASPRTTIMVEFAQILVRIVGSIASARLEYAMNTIIREMCQPTTAKHFCPERMSVGLRAFIHVVDASPKKEISGFFPVHDELYQTNRFSTIKKAVSNKKVWTQSSNDPTKSQISEAFFTTLWHLDSAYGRPFLQTNPTSVQKFSSEVCSGEKKTKFQLLKQCIASLLKFLVTKEVLEDLTDLLTRLSLHVEEDMQNHATAALKLLLLEYPEFRSRILQSVVNTYVSEIPSTCPEVSSQAMANLHKFVQLWRTCLSNEVAETAFQEGFYAIEGFCLIGLCSTLESHRATICQIMRESKAILSILQQKETMEKSVYDEIYRFLVEQYSSKCEGYASIELTRLFEQAFPATPWCHVLALLFRDSQLAFNCVSAVEFARVNGYIKFLSSHMFIESMTNLVDTTSRLSLGRTKKLPNFCDTQSWQNYFTLFCAPAIFYEIPQNSKKPAKPPSAINTFKALEKAISLVRADYTEINDLCGEVLAQTHATVVPLLLFAFEPLIRESMERAEVSTKKRKRRDAIVARLLFIFSKIADNGHFVPFIMNASAKTLQPLLDFCETSRTTLIPSADGTTELALLDLAALLAAICCGLHQSGNTLLLLPSAREQHYRTLLDCHNGAIKDAPDSQERIFRALFGLLCAEGLLSRPAFGTHLPETLELIDFAVANRLMRDKLLSMNISVVDTVEALLLYNDYTPLLVEWVFKRIYTRSNHFSRQLFFVLLKYFERKNHIEPLYIKVMVLLLVFSRNTDSVVFLRIRKCLNFLDKSLGGTEVDSLSLLTATLPVQCQEAVVQHLLDNYAHCFVSLISEFFQIFQECDFAFRAPILDCLVLIFARLSLKNHTDLADLETLTLIRDYETSGRPSVQLDFSHSIMLINNLLYATWTFRAYHATSLRDCWVALCRRSNANFLLVLNYLSALAHFDHAPLHHLLKVVVEFIASSDSTALCTFLSTRLTHEKSSRLRIYTARKYPFVSLSHFSYVCKDCQERRLFGPNSVKSLPTDQSPRFFCLPFFELLEVSESLPTHAALLTIAAYVIPLSTLVLDDAFFLFLHLSINETFSSSHLVSVSCKSLIVVLCTAILGTSLLNDNLKASLLNELNSLTCTLRFSTESMAFSLPRNGLSDKPDSVVSKLARILETIKPTTARNELAFQSGNEQLLYTLLQRLLGYLEFCGCVFLPRWAGLCVHFATESASLNIACYSLFVMRTIGGGADYDHIRRLAVAYCATSQDICAEPKKLAHELLVTIHTIGVSIVRTPASLDANTLIPLIGALIWFFTCAIALEIPNDAHIHLSFFVDLFSLPENFLVHVFAHLDDKTHYPRCLLFAIVNFLITAPSHQEQCLLLVINLGPFCSHPFVSPHPALGLALIALLLAYFYIDYFEGPVEDLSRSFDHILDKMALISSLTRFYNLFHMFRPSNKRKDVSLFLKMLVLEILQIADLHLVRFLIKFLSD